MVSSVLGIISIHTLRYIYEYNTTISYHNITTLAKPMSIYIMSIVETKFTNINHDFQG